jgi:hypothetical protein
MSIALVTPGFVPGLRSSAAPVADRTHPAGRRAAHRRDCQRHAWRPPSASACSLWLPGLVLWIVGHSLAVWGARLDPQFMEVFLRHLKHRSLLDV